LNFKVSDEKRENPTAAAAAATAAVVAAAKEKTAVIATSFLMRWSGVLQSCQMFSSNIKNVLKILVRFTNPISFSLRVNVEPFWTKDLKTLAEVVHRQN